MILTSLTEFLKKRITDITPSPYNSDCRERGIADRQFNFNKIGVR